jgi:Immunoglobulin-like domain of bacterial spore germination
VAAARRRRPRRPGDDVLRRAGFAWLAAAALVAALAGCGGAKKPAKTADVPVRVYFLHQGKVQPIQRFVSAADPLRGAFDALAAGPTGETPMAVTTALFDVKGWTIDRTADGRPSLHTTAELPRAFVAQAVYTLSQFAVGKTVVVNGKRYARKDFEDETPIILVESPLPLAHVTSPLRATGTANTFEATFQYDLRDPAGKLLKTHFVTATSGTGTRGTFDFTVPFTVDRGGMGKLVVYELSAADGSRIHQVEIPIRLAK